ncbi:MAG: hypothetical protein KJO43_11740 [Phycisphaerae bacterium]|nr:hypothetical protein [Phycisphaerae bacterium]NNF43933.1 hypothetical protein [Phycisphaerales bacterium]
MSGPAERRGDPDDPLTRWRTLLEPASQPLLDAVAAGDTDDAATIAAIRRRWPASLVSTAIELVRARRRAAAKFPAVASRLVADVEGVEQATSARVAAHKATRFRAAGCPRVLDLCCGIGGDAMALVNVTDVTAVDLDPLRLWMCGVNAGCATQIADVATLDPAGVAIHLDPARRDEAGRRHRYADYRPGPDVLAALLSAADAGAIKLGPGVDFDALPDTDRREIELISDGRALVQAVLWSGALARQPGLRTATMLPAGVSFTAAPDRPADVPAEDERVAFLAVPDPALERAGLLGPWLREHAGWELHPGLGIVASEDDLSSPWFTSFACLAHLPWREKHLRATLRTLDAGIVEVKTRGGAVDTDRWQRTLRGDGAETLTVFALRRDHRITAWVTRRLGDEA